MIWEFWLVLGVVLFVIEIFTPGFVIASFGLACFAPLITSLFTSRLESQIISFIIGMIIVLWKIRPFFIKRLYNKKDNAKTNADALIGRIGKVLKEVSETVGEGRVEIGGEDWMAISVNDQKINVGEKVEVVKVAGSKIVVKQIGDKH
ncbi:MAG: NfeD family protein [bacterium]